MKSFLSFIFFLAITLSGLFTNAQRIQPGAERFDQYLPLLKGKRVGLFANQTTVVHDTVHLVDVLTSKGVKLQKIFAPEHGFRGTADAGEKVDNAVDSRTGIPVVSLYGKKRKAGADELKDVDVMVFDVQDVGVRFYTYISSLEEFVESAILHNKPVVVLDRPNPNGFYIDGPVLDRKFRSFVGMQPVPVVYGMTMGEYAQMLVGEKWFSQEINNKLNATPKQAKRRKSNGFSLTIISCGNYTHKSKYTLPVKPSPNLPDMTAIYWYPSTCYFEGTVLSEGRGTDHPFLIFGHPNLPKNLYSFTPTSRAGAKEPKLKDQQCFGWNLYSSPEAALNGINGQLQLKYLLEAYRLFPDKANFFLAAKSGKEEDYFFNKLVGNASLMEQIRTGKSESEIRKSWEPGLNQFKAIRKKYLLYPDFY
ncbi:DUF1343 domain-containing protein [Flavihumibacter rivuli]|uniref:exo-beta-N-acetylmuramidase NamZ family protein n=1 Tax=Flavihumibacter rivuli TaxID=2838156 RepID=UPI001BDF704B|nr:DUF1343 domain-containing protein [Flavihumibacter rivuli]ULQ56695.1 DUF1343 domain-containing protein [Flavihumibacter rivuli]